MFQTLISSQNCEEVHFTIQDIVKIETHEHINHFGLVKSSWHHEDYP